MKEIIVNVESVNENGSFGMGRVARYFVNVGELKRKFTRIFVVSKQRVEKKTTDDYVLRF